MKGVVIIKVTKDNKLHLLNINYGIGYVESVVNIDATFLCLSSFEGVEIYNKKY